jgi:hypothetical protein
LLVDFGFVGIQASRGGVATGLVTFEVQSESKKKVTEKVLGAPALDGGVTTLAVKPVEVLNKTITVLYGGDTDFTSSNLTPPVLTQPALKSLARPMVVLYHLRGRRR